MELSLEKRDAVLIVAILLVLKVGHPIVQLPYYQLIGLNTKTWMLFPCLASLSNLPKSNNPWDIIPLFCPTISCRKTWPSSRGYLAKTGAPEIKELGEYLDLHHISQIHNISKLNKTAISNVHPEKKSKWNEFKDFKNLQSVAEVVPSSHSVIILIDSINRFKLGSTYQELLIKLSILKVYQQIKTRSTIIYIKDKIKLL